MNLKGYIIGITLVFISSVIFSSCEKEEVTPTAPQCSCYEVHEVLEPVDSGNGLPVLAWVLEYETPKKDMNCSNETDYYYNNNNTKRWKVVCQ
jgi:hypothetical protein